MDPAGARLWIREASRQTASYAANSILNGWHAVSNLLLPPACAYCQQAISLDRRRPVQLCSECQRRFTPSRQACSRCASPLPDHWPDRGVCPRCRHRRYHFAQAVALGDYRTDVQQAVIWMKQLAHEPLTYAMAHLLADCAAGKFAHQPLDLVVPIPMHPWRRLRRGTQPSLILGSQVARRLGLPMAGRLLYCRRKSLKQGTLSPSERFKNRRGAFSFSPGYDITDRRVLLVDDILTTGATASEAARILCRAGAATVVVAVVARGIGRR